MSCALQHHTRANMMKVANVKTPILDVQLPPDQRRRGGAVNDILQVIMATRHAPVMKYTVLALAATLTLWSRVADAFGVGMTTTTMGMGNSFGRLFRISTWGESHGGGVGVNLDGCPPKLPLTAEDIQVGACFSISYVFRWFTLVGTKMARFYYCKLLPASCRWMIPGTTAVVFALCQPHSYDGIPRSPVALSPVVYSTR